MSVHSAGILLYRNRQADLEIMLVHPGGPLWANKDYGSWSIPKGLFEQDETPLAAAKREFKEETGFSIDGEFMNLGVIKQPSQKIVHAFAVEGDLDVAYLKSNTFALEWPKNSGVVKYYPEVDRGEWFDIPHAKKKITKGQLGFIDVLLKYLKQ